MSVASLRRVEGRRFYCCVNALRPGTRDAADAEPTLLALTKSTVTAKYRWSWRVKEVRDLLPSSSSRKTNSPTSAIGGAHVNELIRTYVLYPWTFMCFSSTRGAYHHMHTCIHAATFPKASMCINTRPRIVPAFISILAPIWLTRSRIIRN